VYIVEYSNFARWYSVGLQVSFFQLPLLFISKRNIERIIKSGPYLPKYLKNTRLTLFMAHGVLYEN